MNKPSQEDFETCRDVLEFMLEHDREHEPQALVTIADIESVLEANSFTESEYE